MHTIFGKDGPTRRPALAFYVFTGDARQLLIYLLLGTACLFGNLKIRNRFRLLRTPVRMGTKERSSWLVDEECIDYYCHFVFKYHTDACHLPNHATSIIVKFKAREMDFPI